MKENRKYDNDDKDLRDNDQRTTDDDQLRSNTMNESIRAASGSPDMNLNDLKDTDQTSDRSAYDDDREGANRMERSTLDQGMSWSPNDASGVRSGGTTDMDNQTSSGAGLNTGRRRGTGSGLEPKSGVTGSDFDGQNASS